jgi:hypothetical protein
MASNNTAGQFKIENGQIMQLLPGDKHVYLTIPGSKELGGNGFPVTFSTEQNKIGRFAFSGDAAIFHDDKGQVLQGKKEQNAWLVCGKNNGQLYINLKYFGEKSTDCSSHTVSNSIVYRAGSLNRNVDTFLQRYLRQR